jgi:deoxyribodipyrimidine photolyase-related protein
LNSGLLTPEQVVRETLSFAKTHEVPLASLEGFLRQIIGWREFIRGIYQNFSDQQENSNFFQHKKKLSDDWYKGTTGIAPLDHAIKKVLKYGYNHHIERLMVIGSLMLLLEVDPKEAHRWFMEMYIDSSDWVMGPNVFGMALFSDGGIFATKPYFCGSNYYRKMGGYKANETWCDAVDGLYWGFIDKHQSFFRKNPRLSMMVRTLEKMDPAKRKRLSKSAEELKKRITRG